MCTRENRLNLNLNAEEIKALTDEIIAKMTKVGDEVAAAQGPRTFENTIAPLARMDREMSPLISNCDFPMNVSTSEEVRNASSDASDKLRKFSVDFGMREDIFEAVKAFEEQRKKDNVQLGPEAARYVERTLRDFKRNGLHLDKAARDKVTELQKKISEREILFQKNINEDKSKLAFSKEDLEGLSDDFYNGLEDAEDGKKYVTLKYPDILPVMQKAKREETRKAMDHLRSHQCEESNVPLLEDTVALREELAGLLGYESHAAYTLEIRMSKATAAVDDMYDKLCPRLAPFASAELARLLKLKEEEKKERGEPFDAKINSWDFMYYHTLLKQKEYTIDEDVVKEYFPLDTVKRGLERAYQRILGLTFTKVEGAPGLWHPDVECYTVEDAASKDFLGYYYLDLYPREGKYDHAAVSGLQCSCDMQPTLAPVDAAPRQCSVACMMANFTKPTATKPSLLQHSEVVTFFHEFGHVMHQLCTKARFAQFAGTATERDFVEAPSQMLENWCWEAQPLKDMSGHYQEAGKVLPEELLQNMLAAKNLNSGLLNLRQVFFGKYDLAIHRAKGRVDTGAEWSRLRESVSLIPNSSGGNGAASFGHIMGGYDAGYYGYLWSEVFSADMFSIFKESGDMYSATVGARYRKCILEPGGSQDGDDMVTSFLGRPLNPDAFLLTNGLISA